MKGRIGAWEQQLLSRGGSPQGLGRAFLELVGPTTRAGCECGHRSWGVGGVRAGVGVVRELGAVRELHVSAWFLSVSSQARA